MFSHSGQRLESQNFWNSSMSICDILELKVTSPTVPFLMSLQEEDPKRSGDQSIDRLASCETNDRSASHLCSQCTSIHDVYRSLPPMHPEHPGRRVPKRHPRIAAPETWDRSCGKSRKIEQNLGQKENKSQDECRCTVHICSHLYCTLSNHTTRSVWSLSKNMKDLSWRSRSAWKAKSTYGWMKILQRLWLSSTVTMILQKSIIYDIRCIVCIIYVTFP